MSSTDPLKNTAWPARVPLLAAGEHVPLLRQVADLRHTHTVYPPQHEIFAALACTPPQAVRVVILGQDPYHGAGQAHGLAFSVREGTRVPRSLANIFKEIRRDVYADALMPPPLPDLTRWARQGVLLLNTVLSVAAGQPGSHARLGWQAVTRAVLEAVAQGPRPVAALLWGRHAQEYAPLFANARHLVLEAAHPSPFSAARGFLGCGHFSRVNAWLAAQGEATICW